MTTTYNITYNVQYDSHEVTFESKPATAVLDALKALKMRWNPKKACWYGFAKEHEIINAILENGEGETVLGEKTEGATVYTDGYLGGGAVYGSKSNLHLYGADLTKAIRADLKAAGIKGVTVRCKRYSGGQSIGVTVTIRPDEFVSLDEYIEKFEPGTCGDYGYIRTESGVYRSGKSWSAKITVDGLMFDLGTYQTPEEAAAVRAEAEKHRPNFTAWYCEWLTNRTESRLQKKLNERKEKCNA